MLKKNNLLSITLGLGCLLSGVASHAESTVTGKVSTLGAGVEYAYALTPKWSFVGGINGASYDYDQTSDGIKYEGKLKLSSFSGGVRYAPWGGAFFLGTGLLINNNEVSLDAQAKNQSFTFNGVTYTTNDLSRVKAKVDFPSVAPSLSLGWQAKLFGSQVSVTPELGVIFQGKPELSTDVTCNLGQTACDTARANVEVERKKLQKDLDGLEIYPLLSLGIGYSF